MGRKRKGLAINGVLVLDKPKGISSNQALQKIKFTLNAAKAGHTGALDPLATGVLPLCFGEATKFSQILLDSDKEYVTKARLGVCTTTADEEGEVISERPVPEGLTQADLESVLAKFKGPQKQTPSMYSALKHKGQPLYKLARQGVEVQRRVRDIFIYELELLSLSLPFIELRVKCSKGTYIRNLVEDIGEVLGCGAHVTELRRTQSGPFTLADSVTMPQDSSSERETLTSTLLPVDSAVSELSKFILFDEQTNSLIQGRTVKLPASQIAEPRQVPLRLYTQAQKRFLGLGMITEENNLQPIRLLNTSDVLKKDSSESESTT